MDGPAYADAVTEDRGSTPLIVCVGGIVLDRHGRLLVIRRGHPPDAGRWSIPGGRVESGESLTTAVAREVLEETGLSVCVDVTIGVVQRPAPGGGIYEIHDFRAHLDPQDQGQPVAGDDATEVRWVSLAELVVLPTVDGLLEALDSWGTLPT